MRWPIVNYGEPKTWLGKAFDTDPVAVWLIACFVMLVLVVLAVTVGSTMIMYFADPATASGVECQ